MKHNQEQVMVEQFSPEAQETWHKLPAWAQAKILNSVWCIYCQERRTILNPEGRLEFGDLLLEGICATCGGKVVRLVETGE